MGIHRAIGFLENVAYALVGRGQGRRLGQAGEGAHRLELLRQLAQAQFEKGDYTASLQTLAGLRAPVDAYFDSVMVNAEAMDVRLNRLGTLQRLHQAMNQVAELARLAA